MVTTTTTATRKNVIYQSKSQDNATDAKWSQLLRKETGLIQTINDIQVNGCLNSIV